MSEIFRIEKRNDFTIVRNGLLRDKTMTLKAKGLLITMLSKPDGWDYTLNGLQTILFEGRDAIASGLTSSSATATWSGTKPATVRALHGRGVHHL